MPWRFRHPTLGLEVEGSKISNHALLSHPRIADSVRSKDTIRPIRHSDRYAEECVISIDEVTAGNQTEMVARVSSLHGDFRGFNI